MKIEEIISIDRILLNEKLLSKKTVLETLALLMAVENPNFNADQIEDRLLSRERLGTTGLGGGIAIPHARISLNGRPLGAFLRTTKLIDFDALDDQPVDLFFGLCVPEEYADEHLDLLAQLANAFSDGEFLEQLRSADSSEQLLENLFKKIQPAKG